MHSISDAGPIKVRVQHADPIARAGLSFACSACADLELQDSATGREPFVGIVVADYASGMAMATCGARDARHAPRVLIVGGSGREWEIRRALERGVRGYLVAGCTPDDVVAGIRAVARGARHLSPEAMARLVESVGCEPLTAREEEVLRLVASGLCNKTIASQLGIAAGTVKSHLKSTFGKLNVQSRTQAVATMQQRGMLEAC